jgi:hypothetical protein
VTAFAASVVAQTNSGGRPIHNQSERLARWKRVEMPFDAAGLSARERQMVAKLVDASRLLDEIYWRQSDVGGYEIYKTTGNPVLKRLLFIMGGRWDLVDHNRPFLGEVPVPPGREFYPHDLTQAKVEQYVRQRPEDKAAIYNPYTVVRWRGDRLTAIPYREEYKPFLEPMAKALREAAALSPDAAFANFLRLRAAALLTDDYYKSDIAWIDLKDPKFDLIFGPYETYLDELLGVKTSFGAAVLIRNEEETRKLALYQKHIPEIQDALPLEAADRPSKRGHVMPMEVMDAPHRAGDLLHGYQAVADNLPNDPRIHQEKGSKKIFFKNFMDARVAHVILPIAQKLMEPRQAAKVSGEGYLAGVVLHEIAHGLGPAFARKGGRQADIGEEIGPVYAALEEAKADIAGMFGLQWLVDRGALPKKRLEEFYASYLAGIFRTIRFGTAEPHGRAELMEFNYLSEQKVVTQTGARYAIDYVQAPAAIAKLAKELLEMEATGDRARAEAWFAKYGTMPAELKAALAATNDIPVDIEPVFSSFEKATTPRPLSELPKTPGGYPARRSPGTVIVDASEFYHQIPPGDTIGGGQAAGAWFFNNSVINLASKEDAVAYVAVPEDGAYRLFVRSQGTETSGFKVSVARRQSSGVFGRGALSWQPSETFELKRGTIEVRLTAIEPRPTMDVIVLSKNTAFGEKELRPLELPDEVVLLKDYKIPPASIVKFGDVDGDSRTDFLVLTPSYSAYMYNHDGKELWHWDAPEKDARLRGEFEAPGSIWDFDQDGHAEVVHWRIENEKEWLVMADGRTGAVKDKAEWPTRPMPHVYNNFRTAIAKFHAGYPDHLLVFTDSGGTIRLTAYDRELQQVWDHTERRAKDFFGHYIYPIDVTGDGIDEVFISHLCLDAKGKVLWNNYHLFDDNHDHMDSMDFFDIDGDGKLELLAGQSDVGALAYNAQTGKLLWQNLADHTQQIAGGRILKGSKSAQVVANGRIYGSRGSGGLAAQLYWFDNQGNLLLKWPRSPLGGNPDFVRGDWNGDGSKVYFWHRFRLEDDGRGTLYFKEPVYHMFDFLGNGAEQVITSERGVLRVYGRRDVKARPVKRDAEYKRNPIANHTHY